MNKREIVSDVLRYETKSNGEIFVVSKIDSAAVEYLLKPLLNKPFLNKFNSKGESVMLIKSDIDYLAKRLREQYEIEWKAENFNNHKIIQQSEMFEYLKKYKDNQVVMISDPIYIKNDNTVFIYFTNFCCGELYGNTSLALYKKTDGLWKKWFQISNGSF
jgi:hypothetical protein